MQDLIEDIISWQRKTFPDTSAKGTLRHMAEELAEAAFELGPNTIKYEGALLANLLKSKADTLHDSETDSTEKGINAELADIFLLLVQLADITNVNLYEAVKAKMALNDIRNWETDEHGINRHT